jgi:hypothetical protein
MANGIAVGDADEIVKDCDPGGAPPALPLNVIFPTEVCNLPPPPPPPLIGVSVTTAVWSLAVKIQIPRQVPEALITIHGCVKNVPNC